MSDSEQRLHGEWNDSRNARYCEDCDEYVPLAEWPAHKSDLAKKYERLEDRYTA